MEYYHRSLDTVSQIWKLNRPLPSLWKVAGFSSRIVFSIMSYISLVYLLTTAKTKIMAKLLGALQIEGTFGGMTFINTKHGIIVRKKSTLSADRVANDKCFTRTRQNNAEFTNAAKGAKLLRLAINEILCHAKDAEIATRLFSTIMKVVKSDKVNDQGERNIASGDISMLDGFECNKHSLFLNAFPRNCESSIDRLSGSLKIHIPAFVPAESAILPEGATHFKLVSAGGEIDFKNETYNVSTNATGLIEWNNATVDALTFSNSISRRSAHTLFIVVGIQFFKLVNNDIYPVQNNSFNALSIVKTSNPVLTN